MDFLFIFIFDLKMMQVYLILVPFLFPFFTVPAVWTGFRLPICATFVLAS